MVEVLNATSPRKACLSPSIVYQIIGDKCIRLSTGEDTSACTPPGHAYRLSKRSCPCLIWHFKSMICPSEHKHRKASAPVCTLLACTATHRCRGATALEAVAHESVLRLNVACMMIARRVEVSKRVRCWTTRSRIKSPSKFRYNPNVSRVFLASQLNTLLTDIGHTRKHTAGT